jgi:hypothetical protein
MLSSVDYTLPRRGGVSDIPQRLTFNENNLAKRNIVDVTGEKTISVIAVYRTIQYRYI